MRWKFYIEELIRFAWARFDRKIRRSLSARIAYITLNWILFRLGGWGIYELVIIFLDINEKNSDVYAKLNSYVTPSQIEWIISLSVLIISIITEILQKYSQRKAGKFILDYFSSWFKDQFKNYFDIAVRKKYRHDLHVRSSLEQTIVDSILISKIYKAELKNLVNEFKSIYGRKLKKLHNEIDEVNQLVLSNSQLNITDSERVQILKHKKELLGYWKITRHLVRRIQFGSIHKVWKNDSLDKMESSWQNTIELLDDFIDRLFQYRSSVVIYDVQKEVDYTIESVSRLKNSFSSFVRILNKIQKVNNNVLHIHGGGGVGKTHFLAHIAFTRNKNQRPVVFLSGSKFNDATSLSTHFKNLLDISDNNTLEEVLGELNRYGRRRKIRVPILIDGLNETLISNSGYSTIWAEHLNNFEVKINEFPYLVLITSLRSDYIPRIFDLEEYEESRLNLLPGFGDDRITENAVSRYFEEYKIRPEDSDNIPTPFFIPLYLKFYCEAHKSSDNRPVLVNFSDQTLYDVFDKTNENLNREINTKLNLDHESNVVISSLNSVASKMRETKGDYITYRDFLLCTDKIDIQNDAFDKDRLVGLKILENELLFIRDENDQNETIVKYTYQMYGGYSIGKYLSESGIRDEEIILEFDDDYSDNTIKEDILKFLICQKMLTNDFNNHLINEAPIHYIVDVIVNMPSNQISANHREYISDLFKEPRSNRERIFSTYYKAQHLSKTRFFNAKFYNEELSQIHQHEIDLTWTHFILQEEEYFTNFVDDLLKSEIKSDQWKKWVQKFHTCVGLLSSNIRGLRIKVIKCLVKFGEVYPSKLIDVIDVFWNKGDVYVYEGLTLACYGVALRHKNDDQFNEHLKKFSEHLYSLQFDPHAQENSVYNINVINTIRQLIMLSKRKGIEFLTENQFEQVSNYIFSGPGNWRVCRLSECRLLQPSFQSAYQHNHVSPFRMDFIIYTTPRVLQGVSDDEYFNEKHRAVYNIYSRILQYGWDESEFESIEVFNRTSLLNDSKIDRFGKKYCWLAYYDYAGYLLSKGKLKNKVKDDEYSNTHEYYVRISDEYIDPAFTSLKEEEFRILRTKLIKYRKPWVNKLRTSILGGNWTKIDQTNNLIKRIILKQENKRYVMLKGYVRHLFAQDDYSIRTTLDIKTYLIENKYKEEFVRNIGIDQKSLTQIHSSGDLSNVFPGELYWSDFVPNFRKQDELLFTGKYETVDYEVDMRDWEEYPEIKPGTVVKKRIKVNSKFEYLSTTSHLHWEGENSMSAEVLLPNIARDLNFEVNVSGFNIVDGEGFPVMKRVNFNNDLVEERHLFIEESTLLKYLKEQNSFILLSCNQNSIDNELGGHENFTKYHIIS